jgi:hypothetical protein
MTADVFDQMATDQAALATQQDKTPLKRLLASLTTLRERIAKGQALLTELQAQERLLVQRDVPDALKALGVRGLALDDGTVVEIAESIQTKISEAHREAAHAWLVAHAHGGVIKRLIEVDVARSEESTEQVETVLAVVDGLGLSATVSESVHASTLKALVREILATESVETPEADKLPRDVFGVFVVEQAEIKPPKPERKKAAFKKAR